MEKAKSMSAPLKFFHQWRDVQVREDMCLNDAMGVINQTGSFMACVVDGNDTLIGILTDSDIRRALLKGASTLDKISNWMNRTPIVASEHASEQELLDITRDHGIREIPLLDVGGRLADIFVLLVHDKRGRLPFDKEEDSRFTDSAPALQNPLLILAGGLGSRLRAVVNDRPKPLAIVGGRPILQTVIQKAAKSGFRQIYVSVNYMADQIRDHLALDIYQDLDIRIVEEDKKLGTAGCIGLIRNEINHPLLVCNADILTTGSYNSMIHTFQDEVADVLCAVRPYRSKVPFGVCEIRNNRIVNLVEKPETEVMVNAGIYILSPEICRWVEKDKYMDMPDLIKAAMAKDKVIKPFYLHEYWIDIGRPEDFSKANEEFHNHFGSFLGKRLHKDVDIK